MALDSCIVSVVEDVALRFMNCGDLETARIENLSSDSVIHCIVYDVPLDHCIVVDDNLTSSGWHRLRVGDPPLKFDPRYDSTVSTQSLHDNMTG